MKRPMQRVGIDEHGTARFEKNTIVERLLDEGPFDLNKIACWPNISKADREQFAQLIGYSVGGFSELPYVRDKTYARAEKRARKALGEDS